MRIENKIVSPTIIGFEGSNMSFIVKVITRIFTHKHGQFWDRPSFPKIYNKNNTENGRVRTSHKIDLNSNKKQWGDLEKGVFIICWRDPRDSIITIHERNKVFLKKGRLKKIQTFSDILDSHLNTFKTNAQKIKEQYLNKETYFLKSEEIVKKEEKIKLGKFLGIKEQDINIDKRIKVREKGIYKQYFNTEHYDICERNNIEELLNIMGYK